MSYAPVFDGSCRLTALLAAVLPVVNLTGGLAFCLQVKGRLHVKGRTGQAEPVGGVLGSKGCSRANCIANGVANSIEYGAPPQEAHRGMPPAQGACWTTGNAEHRWPCQSGKLQGHSEVRKNEGAYCAQRTSMVGAVASGGAWGGFSLNSWPRGRGSLGATVPMAEVRFYRYRRPNSPFEKFPNHICILEMGDDCDDTVTMTKMRVIVPIMMLMMVMVMIMVLVMLLMMMVLVMVMSRVFDLT